LVDHAISFYTAGRKDDPDALVVVFPNCQRRFPWQRSYNWSREGAGHYCVTSALMALEAWGHRRIEAGEPLGPVLADILGPPGSPAAYVLVAVDLLLSHWPQSGPSAVPFLACPELLCLDRQRYFLDNTVYPDILGVSALLTEPKGLASGDSLKKRASRQTPLDSVVGAFAGAGAERIELTGLLTEAVARLGPPNDDATLGDPAQMAAYALNLCDPANWREVVIEQADGTRTTARQYVSPESERQHFERLQRSSAERLEDGNMQRAIDRALDDASRSNPSFAEKAVAWAQKAEGAAGDNAGDAQWVREQAVYAAAMIAMRDGAAELRARQAAWAQGVFERALQTPEDSSHRVRSGLRFNPSAIAFAGLIHALRDGVTPEKLRQLLEVAARNDPAAAHGLGVAASTLAAIDERLPRAVLRSALATATRPRHVWDEPDADFARQKEEQRATVQTAVEAELAWLAGNGAEPDWCAMAASTVRRRRGFTIPSGVEEEAPATKEDRRPEEYVDHQAVALWVQQCMPLADMTKRPWLRDVVRFYGRWTAEANGAGLERGAEISDPPRGWNGAYFELLARCLPGLSATEIDEIALDPITALPDEPFFDVMSEFLRDVDVVFFNDNGLEPAIAAHIRSRLGDRLAASRGWQRLVGSPSSSVEYHIAPAVATLFFNGHNSFQPTKCYLYAPAIKRLTVFLPILEALIEKGPSFFAALVTLNLFEVSPLPEHLAIVVKAGLTWLRAYPDSTAFWIDCTFGRRVCGLIEKICAGDAALPTPPQQTEPNQLLAALVRLGVAEAARLERSLAEHRLMGVSPG